MVDATPIAMRRLVRCGAAVAGMIAVGHVDAAPAQEAGGDSVTVAAGDHYAAGGLRRFFFGGFYRDLWTGAKKVAFMCLRFTS